MSIDPFPRARTGLDHCVIHVGDWEASNRFYRDVCGATVVETGAGGFAYRFGEQQLNCHGPGVDATPLAEVPVVPGGSDVCLTWAGTVEEAVEHLERHDVEVVEGPVERFGARGAGTSVYFRDPDGSLLELIVYADAR